MTYRFRMPAPDQLPELIFSIAVSLALSAVALGALYWVVRLAVRHALEDAERRRSPRRR